VKPRLLDLFCGAGGATRGYQAAGFHVIGVDIEPQPNYCGDDFIQADVIEFLAEMLERYYPWAPSAAIHASPPCQLYTPLHHRTGRFYSGLVYATRNLLQQTGVPYVIENVPGAPLQNPIRLCGSSLGLGANGRQLRRHRLFECSFPVMAPPCAHHGQPVGVYGTGGGGQMTRGYKGTPEEYREAMGIDWATRAEIAQAIPPAYTEHIGGYLMAAVQKVAA
jgi:DNA (cytosine-5)-methyltransferase 1